MLRSEIELKIASLFKSIETGFPEYLEVYMGTKWGGFVSSFEGEMSAGYDPRERAWYGIGSDAKEAWVFGTPRSMAKMRRFSVPVKFG